MATDANAFSKIQAGIASRLMAAGMAAANAATVSFVAVAGGIIGILALVGTAFKDAGDEQDKYLQGYQGLVDFAEAHRLSDALGLDEINAQIDEQAKLIADFEEGTGEASKAIVDAARDREATLIGARNVELIKSMEGEADLIAQLTKTNNQLFFEAMQITDAREFSNQGQANKFRTELYNELFLDREQLRKDNQQFFDLLKENSVNSLEEYNVFSQQVLENNGQDAEQIAGNTADAISGTVEELDKFNNKREELFAGFSQGNLTGDLIRQVNQQGVENLITNTEVVMTNVFNGMTIPEVADQIIEEIESRANLAGFNLAG